MRFRYNLRKLHYWASLLCGMIFFILCITGSIYLFRNEIEHLTANDRYCISSQISTKKRCDLNALVKQLEKRHNAKVESIFIPANPQRTYRIIMNNGAQGNIRLRFDIDPFTGKITGEGSEKCARFFRVIKKLHTSLGLPKQIGEPIIFYASVLFIPIIFSGLFLWFPAGGMRKLSWRNSLSIHFFSGRKRLFFDLHHVLGFIIVFPLLILIVTGIIIAFHPHGKTVASFYDIPKTDMTNTISESPLLESIVKQIRKQEPKSDLLIRLPSNLSQNAIRVDIKKSSFYGTSIATVSYWNGANSKLIIKKEFSDLTWRQKIAVLVVPLHYGDFLGTCSKIICLLICLAGASLPITGLLR